LEKYRSQEIASNKLEKGPLRDYETGFCSSVAIMVLEKIFRDLAYFHFLFGKYSEPREQILKRTPQGTFLAKISFLGVIGEQVISVTVFLGNCEIVTFE
jgi:hypothetical protein